MYVSPFYNIYYDAYNCVRSSNERIEKLSITCQRGRLRVLRRKKREKKKRKEKRAYECLFHLGIVMKHKIIYEFLFE